MSLSPVGPGTPGAQRPAPDVRDPRTRQEAAAQFETVLVRQFVEVMTKDLFKESLAGEGALGAGQADLQRDTLTDVLTEHLVKEDALRLRDLLLKNWSSPDAPDAAPAR